MAGRGRPAFKATKPLRDRVKLLKADGWSNDRIARQLGIARNTLEKKFAEELEFGADAKRVEILEAADKAAKKGNATMIKWLADRRDVARAAEQVADREAPSAAAPLKPPAKGKKEIQQQAAEEITGKFAPPSPPKLH